ncbi:MAG TPA: creatininase family protein [Oceanobacillus sp.]|nr:creatininase family protein [Oceanobacillus sp.]
MRFQDMHWMDVERYLQQDTRVILVTGSTEQHAYLSLLTDILIPSRIALAVAEREGVLVAPPLNFGVSQHFTEFPGTISLSPSTFELVLSEMVDSLLHQGFTRFFILNGHGGNRIPPRLQDLDYDGLARIEWYDWWRESATRAFEAEHNLRLDHANWGENFAFTRVGEVPAGEKPPVNLELLEEGESIRDVIGDGSYGGPYQVDEALSLELFERVVNDVCGRVRAMREI